MQTSVLMTISSFGLALIVSTMAVGQDLDPRIDASKITELAPPPPLPEQVVLPMPPEHRIATSAEFVPISAAHYQRARTAINRGIVQLLDMQHERGGWMIDAEARPTDQPTASPVATAVTALAIKAIVQASTGDHTPRVRKAMTFIQTAQTSDGSFGGGALSNYVTSTVVQALAGFDDDELADGLLNAVTWLQTSQWDASEGVRERQDWYGGAGYGNRGRPDMSNTQMMLDALYDTGMSPDEPAFQRALAFITRAQNLQATNKADWAGNDGGFVYTPANGGESMASEAAGEGRHGEIIAAGARRSLRSYGSMTYAGFKSMLYAGLSADDPRVRAAFDWIRRHFTFDENPGLGQQGLFYYYHTMARALVVSQQHHVTDVSGVSHNWREELIDAILERQRPNGLWRNDADRWLEGRSELATVHALLALEEALKPALGFPKLKPASTEETSR